MKPEIKTIAAAEEWRPVKGYEGMYEVSNLGRVRSLDRMVSYVSKYGKHYQVLTKGRILAMKQNLGYYLVHLSYQGEAVHKQVHRLVAEAFIPNPYNLPEVNHKDEDGQNNTVGNLEWCTTLYNIRYGTAIERRASKIRKPIAQFTKDGIFIRSYKSVTEAAHIVHNGRQSVAVICTCAKGKRQSAYGYHWQYI